MKNLTRELADGALDGLALIEASAEDNPRNRESILTHADTVLLVSGLVIVAAMLRQALAQAHGCPETDIDTLIRHTLIAAGDAASEAAS